MRRPDPLWTRRRLLAAGAGFAAASALPAGAAVPTRTATLDWAILETLLALGNVPVAATELRQFRDVAVEPIVPASVADLGLRGLANFETLLLARPDIIFNSNFYAQSNDRLRRIAPVEAFTLFLPGRSPYEPALEMTRAIAKRLALEPEAEVLIADTDALFGRLRARLGAGDGRPVLPINLGDARHFRAFGFDSIFGQAVEKLGLTNAWDRPTSYSAAAPIGIETLARYEEAWIVIIAPVPPEALPVLERGAFWKALPAVRAGRVLTLPSANPFGALPACARFACLLVDALPYATRDAQGG